MTKRNRGTLFKVEPSDISPNPHNPRLFFDEGELKELKSSIEKVGILVPLTIYRNTKNYPKSKYVLLDGERRWRCATELGFKEVPANIIDEPKDITQNILFMFNIHHFRREWELFPTALKLELLIKRLDTDHEATLSNFTGVNRSMIRRCKKLLWFPEKYRNILMDKGGKISTDFFIEIYPIAYRLSHEEDFAYPNKIQTFIDTAISKFDANIINDVKEFREVRRCMAHFEAKSNFSLFKKRINRFIEVRRASLDIFELDDVLDDRNRRGIIKYANYLLENIKGIDPNLISDEYTLDLLKELRSGLDKLLTEAD